MKRSAVKLGTDGVTHAVFVPCGIIYNRLVELD